MCQVEDIGAIKWRFTIHEITRTSGFSWTIEYSTMDGQDRNWERATSQRIHLKKVGVGNALGCTFVSFALGRSMRSQF